jgi:hypothetical protein
LSSASTTLIPFRALRNEAYENRGRKITIFFFMTKD